MARQHVQVDADEIAYLKVIPNLEKWSKKNVNYHQIKPC